MAVRIELKNSNVADKRPTADQISNYELALNYNAEGPFLCCKDSDGNIQQVGGVKLSEDAPGSPVKQTMWVQPSTQKLFVFDGDRWIDFGSGGGGGGGGAVDQILAGDGLNSSPASGVGTITLETDIDQSKGLEYVSGSLAVAAGSGLQFDLDGNLEVTAQPLVYKGTLDLTSDDAKPSPVSTGDTWANVEAGTSDAVWNPDIPTGASVSVGDLVAYDGAKWTLIPVGTPTSGRTDLGVDNKTAFAFDVTSSTGSNVTLPAATDSEAGLMTAEDKNSVDNGWQRINETLSPVNAGDDVLIGGTLPSAPATTLGSDGSAQFKENVDVGEFTSTLTNVSGARLSKSGTVNVQRTAATASSGQFYAGWKGTDRTFFVSTNGGIKIGGTTSNSTNPKITLNGDGSATLGGNLTISYPGTNSDPNGARYLDFNNTDTTLVANQPMGGINWIGNDDSNPNQKVASILAYNQANTGSTGYLVFNTGEQEKARLLNGNLLIGGVLPSEPAIELNADGSSSFKKLDVETGSNTEGQVVASFYGGSGGAARGLEIKLGTTNSVDNALVTLDSKQASAGQLALATKGAERLRIDNSGNIRIGSTLPDNPTIRLNADGSSTFNGDMGIGDAAATGGTGIRLTSDGLFKIGRDLGTGSKELVTLNSFVTSAGVQNPFVFAGSDNLLSNSTSGTYTSIIYNDGSARFGGSLPAAPAIRLDSNGSASFLGNINVGNLDTAATGVSGSVLQNNGTLKLQKTNGNETFYIYNGTTKNVSIAANGSAAFAGDVDAGAVKAAGSSGGVDSITAGTTSDPKFFVVRGNGTVLGSSGGAASTSNYAYRLNASGSAQFAGSVSIGGTAANNTISNYETGLWLPEFTLRSPTGSPTLTTNRVAANANVYVKVGNLVTVFLNINASNVVDLEPTDANANTLYIGTLPFTVSASMSGLSLGYVVNFDTTWSTTFSICGAASGSTIVLYQNNKATNSKTFLGSESLTAGSGLSSSTNRLQGSISYYTND